MWILGTIPQLIIGIILAYALNSALIKMQGFFRVSVFMPYVTSTVAVAIVFGVMFNSQEFGLMNVILSWFGQDPVSWSTSWWGVKIAISSMVFWRWVGYNTIIYLAGLQAIPHELYEAAQIDGATVRQKNSIYYHPDAPSDNYFNCFYIYYRCTSIIYRTINLLRSNLSRGRYFCSALFI